MEDCIETKVDQTDEVKMPASRRKLASLSTQRSSTELSDVEIAPSPKAMRRRLRSIHSSKSEHSFDSIKLSSTAPVVAVDSRHHRVALKVPPKLPSKSIALTMVKSGSKKAAAFVEKSGLRLPDIVVDPRSVNSLMWDLFIGLLIIISGILIPLEVGFPQLFHTPVPGLKGSTKDTWEIMMIFMDCTLFLDILRSFFTGFYENDDRFIRTQPQMALNYLKGWFLIDLVSTMPWQAIILTTQSVSSLKLIRIVRLARVVKVLRLLKVLKISQNLEEHLYINPSVLKLLLLCFEAAYFAHLTTCLWHVVSEYEYSVFPNETWYNATNTDFLEEGSSVSGLYLYCLYWTMATITAVGYGDVTAVTAIGRAYSIFVQLTGAAIFGLLIGNISAIVESFSKRSALAEVKMASLDQYLKERGISRALQTRLTLYFRQYFRKTTSFHEKSILAEISPSLRNDIVHHEHRRTLFQIPVYQRIDHNFVMDMTMFLTPLILHPGQTIAHESEIGTQMFMLQEGIIEVTSVTSFAEESQAQDHHHEHPLVLYEVINQPSYFGDIPLLSYSAYEYSFTSRTYGEVLCLKQEDFACLVEEYPEAEYAFIREMNSREQMYRKVHRHTLQVYEQYLEGKPLVAPLRVVFRNKIQSMNKFPIGVLRYVRSHLDHKVPVSRSARTKEESLKHNRDDPQDRKVRSPCLVDHHQNLHPAKYTINPRHPVKMLWDMWLGLLILYSVVAVPFKLGFDYSDDRLAVFEGFVDIMFGLDILLNFRTCYIDSHGKYIDGTWEIARKYGSTWFLVDFLSTAPIDQFVVRDEVGDKTPLQNLKLIRMAKLTRLLKLARLFKLNRTLGSTASVVNIRPTTALLMKLLIQISFVAHLSACGFAFVGSYSQDELCSIDKDCSWLSRIAPNATAVVTLSEKYATSIYWAFTTMVTVGYGDILPVNKIELIYVTFCMVVAASIFGYFIGSMAALVGQLNSPDTFQREKLDQIEEYMVERDFPRLLCVRIRRYYKYYLSRLELMDENEILYQLSNTLRTELVIQLNRKQLGQIPFFQSKDDDCIAFLLGILVKEFCLPQDYLVRQGEMARKMFFLLKGTVQVLQAKSIPSDSPECPDAGNTSEEPLAILQGGTYFGELAMLMPVRRAASIKALSYCQYYSLSRTCLEKIALKYPEIVKDLLDSVQTRYPEYQNKALMMKLKLQEAIDPPGDTDAIVGVSSPNSTQALGPPTELLEEFDQVVAKFSEFFDAHPLVVYGHEDSQGKALNYIIKHIRTHYQHTFVADTSFVSRMSQLKQSTLQKFDFQYRRQTTKPDEYPQQS